MWGFPQETSEDLKSHDPSVSDLLLTGQYQVYIFPLDQMHNCIKEYFEENSSLGTGRTYSTK